MPSIFSTPDAKAGSLEFVVVVRKSIHLRKICQGIGSKICNWIERDFFAKSFYEKNVLYSSRFSYFVYLNREGLRIQDPLSRDSEK